MAKSNKTYDEEARNDEFNESSPEYDVACNINGTMHDEQPELPSLDGFEEMIYYGANAGSRYRRGFTKKGNCNNGKQNQKSPADVGARMLLLLLGTVEMISPPPMITAVILATRTTTAVTKQEGKTDPSMWTRWKLVKRPP